MPSAIVSSSQIAQFGRMDAAFHLAVTQTKELVQKLEASITAKELVSKLESLTTEDLSALQPLLTGQERIGHRPSLLKAITAYPYIAFALVQQNIDTVLGRALIDVSTALKRVETLESIQALK